MLKEDLSCVAGGRATFVSDDLAQEKLDARYYHRELRQVIRDKVARQPRTRNPPCPFSRRDGLDT